VVEIEFAEQIEDPKYAELVEKRIQVLLKDKINKHFETSEEAEAALNKDLKTN